MAVCDAYEEGQVSRLNVVERDGSVVALDPGFLEASSKVFTVFYENPAMGYEDFSLDYDFNCLLVAPTRRERNRLVST